MLFSGIHKIMQQSDVAMEAAIDFQPDRKFGKELEAEIADLMKGGAPSGREIARSKLGQIVTNHTGLQTQFEATDDFNAYFMFEGLPTNQNVLMSLFSEYMDNDGQVEFLKKNGDLNFTVDLRYGRVNGLSEKVVHTMALGAGMFDKAFSMTAGELTAIVLHEVGHMLSFYTCLHRTMSTNWVLTDFLEKWLDTEDKQKRITLAAEARKVGVENELFEHLDENNAEQAKIIIVSSEVRRSKSELGVDIYDARSWEQLADQYANRWGYGRELASGLRKFSDLWGTDGRSGRFSGLFFALILLFIGAALAVGGVAAIALAGGEAALLGFYGLLFGGVLYMPLFFDNQIQIYDTDRDRQKAIRKDMVAVLKTTKDPKVRKELTDAITEIKKNEHKLGNDLSAYAYLQSVLGFVNGRRVWRHTSTQKLLEHFANSDLHHSIARLED